MFLVYHWWSTEYQCIANVIYPLYTRVLFAGWYSFREAECSVCSCSFRHCYDKFVSFYIHILLLYLKLKFWWARRYLIPLIIVRPAGGVMTLGENMLLTGLFWEQYSRWYFSYKETLFIFSHVQSLIIISPFIKVLMRLFSPRKTTLLLVIRDKTKVCTVPETVQFLSLFLQFDIFSLFDFSCALISPCICRLH